MKSRLTSDQRKRVIELLDQGLDRGAIASDVGVTPAQVSAVAAHRTMGTYASETRTPEPTATQSDSDVKSAVLSQAVLTNQFTVPLGTNIDGGDVVTWAPYESTNPQGQMLARMEARRKKGTAIG